VILSLNVLHVYSVVFLPYRNSEIVIVGGINYPGSAFVLNVQTGINIKKNQKHI
jgi:hypothetical protein